MAKITLNLESWLEEAKRLADELADWRDFLEKSGYIAETYGTITLELFPPGYKHRHSKRDLEEKIDNFFADLSAELEGYRGIKSFSAEGSVEIYEDGRVIIDWPIKAETKIGSSIKIPQSEEELLKLLKKADKFESELTFIETWFYDEDGNRIGVIVHFEGRVDLF